jgi:sec-independent protein translocase protein TatB
MNGTIFGIGPLEIAVVAVLILVVLGPERLPGLMRDLGKMTRSLRKYYVAFSTELKREIEPFRDDIQGIKDAADGLREDLGAIAQAADIRGIITGTDAGTKAANEQTIAPPATTIATPVAEIATASPSGNGTAAVAVASAPAVVIPPIVRFDVPLELDEDSPWVQAFQPPRADRLDEDNPWASV